MFGQVKMSEWKKAKLNQNSLNKLNKLYKKFPETTGCLEHILLPKDKGGCGGQCCEFLNPSVFYCEFLNSWNNVLETWNIDKIMTLIERALDNHMSLAFNKSCIFWDKKTKLCTQHKHRPANCYFYGITPEEEFNQRIVRLRVIHKDDISAVIKDQCNLVKTEDGKIVKSDQMNEWFEELKTIEESIGIDKKFIHDGEYGTYRTFHDHIMIYLFSDEVLKKLSLIKESGDEQEILLAKKNYIQSMRNKFQKILGE